MELWDIYDKNGILTGRTHERGMPLKSGDYHMIVDVWVMNKNGEFLLTKRAPGKVLPHMWECSEGSALRGENALAAALREVKEETGITLKPENGRCVMRSFGEDTFKHVWLFRQNFDASEIALQEGETCDWMTAKPCEIIKLRSDGKLVPFTYLDELFEMI